MLVCMVHAAHREHAPQHEWMDGRLVPYHEAPDRIALIEQALVRAGHTIVPAGLPDATGWDLIASIHDPDYLQYLATAYDSWTAAGGAPEGLIASGYVPRSLGRRPSDPLALPGWYGYDGSGVIVAGTWEAAQAAAGCALHSARLLQGGVGSVYAACRPPGHHAYRDRYGGFCFLNNAALAAELLRQGDRRVAVLDIDFHHGNGTQRIFEGSDSVLFVSIHGDPARVYPYFSGYADERGSGTGLGFTNNYPLEAGVDDRRYLVVLEQACHEIEQFRPHALVVSAGFDTYQGDPLGDFAITRAGFAAIGERIATLALPTVIIQEGGYAIAALGENVGSFLRGWTY